MSEPTPEALPDEVTVEEVTVVEPWPDGLDDSAAGVVPWDSPATNPLDDLLAAKALVEAHPPGRVVLEDLAVAARVDTRAASRHAGRLYPPPVP